MQMQMQVAHTQWLDVVSILKLQVSNPSFFKGGTKTHVHST